MTNSNRPFFLQLFSKKLVISFLMGISSGLPLLITISLLQAWAKDSGISLKEIGLMALVGLPYTLKFFWAPLFDRFTLPFLGRRRGWLIITQILTALAIVFMGASNPAQNISYFVITAALLTFFSASQDIVIDAYRREDLKDHELGIGSSYYVYGYRIGMLFVSGGGMILADHLSWFWVFTIMALLMIPGILTTLWCPEPKASEGTPTNFKEAVFDPFINFFSVKGAFVLLVFILLYKIGDNMAAALSTPFYLELGFSKTQIGVISKLYGFWGTIGGAFIGGALLLKLGINKSLWIFGVLQMISTAGFFLLSKAGANEWFLASVVTFENISSGMGTAAFMAFMAKITNKKYTATQYALLTSFMGVPRTLVSASSGYLQSWLGGWPGFFIFCTLIALPGMLLLLKFAPYRKDESDLLHIKESHELAETD